MSLRVGTQTVVFFSWWPTSTDINRFLTKKAKERHFAVVLNVEFYFRCVAAAADAASLQTVQGCPNLCDPTDGSPSGSLIPGIFQARTLEWVAISFSNAWKWKVKVAQSSPTLSDSMDCSPPGSSVHGLFQATVLEWGAIAFSGCVTRYALSCLELYSRNIFSFNLLSYF